MRFLVLRSVPLGAQTREAWRNQGAVFRKRSATQAWQPKWRDRFDFVLNLGSRFPFDPMPSVETVNHPDDARKLMGVHPAAATLGDLQPAAVLDGPHWHKRDGWRGQGKVFHERRLTECQATPGIVQAHVEGTEFRVLTVDERVVQAFRKVGAAPNFGFQWVGVEGVAKNGIIPLVKRAMERVDPGGIMFVGWDIIVGPDGPVILEPNLSPGVNNASAERVVNMIGRLI